MAAEGSLYQMNPLEMLGALPKLEWCSDRILRQWKRQGFSYRGFMKYITNATEEIRLKHSWEEEYVYSKKRFGDKHFINVDQATEALPAVDHINWDPVGLYHKANLAQMALDIIYFSNGTNPESPLDIIDSLFPMPFAPYWEDDCGLPRETIREEIFRIGLEIRTQRFVRKAIALPRKKSPKSMLEETFNNASFGDAELRGWEMDGLQDEFGGITQEYHDRLEGRVRELRQSFRNDDSKLFDASALEASFPWSEFVVKLAEWIRQRIFQLDERSAAQENRDAAIAKLHAELQRRPNGTVRRRRMLRPESVLAQSSKPENTIMENIKSRAQHEPVGVPPPQRQLTPPVAPNKYVSYPLHPINLSNVFSVNLLWFAS